MRSRGFTFAEIIVATLVMMIAVVPFFTNIQNKTKQARYNKIRAFAMSLAQNYLERIRGCSYDYLRTGECTEPSAAGASCNSGACLVFNHDPITHPKAGLPGVPTDPEMKALLEQWDARSASFNAIPVSAKEDQGAELIPAEMQRSRMLLLGVIVCWGKETNTHPVPKSTADLNSGAEHLSLACLSGEALFHPPIIERDMGASPP